MKGKAMRKTSWYGSKPARRYDGVILTSRKGAGAMKTLKIFTKQEGPLTVFVRQGRSKKGFGALMALGELTFEAIEQNGAHTLTEYSCRNNRALSHLTWEAYVYAQIFIEMVLALTIEGQAEPEIYQLLVLYGRAIEVKDPRIVTIIMGWQLLAVAGFYPDTDRLGLYQYIDEETGENAYGLIDAPRPEWQEIPLPEGLRPMWQQVLQYRWDQEQTIHFKASQLSWLEKLLYLYTEQCSERPLKSVALLQS